MKIDLSAILKEFVDHSIIGMLAFQKNSENEECVVVFGNGRANEILESADMAKVQVKELFPEAARLGTFNGLSYELLQREGMTSEILMRKMNGHHFIANVSVKHINVESQQIVLLTFQDVTIERKLSREIQTKQSELERAYSELLEQNRALKDLDHAKDKFIALTTHELRTPLSAILATAEVLEMQLYESEQQKEEFIKTIGEQGRHLMELVNDILDFAKVRAGKMDFYIESLNLKEMITQLLANYSHMADQNQVKLTIDFADISPSHGWADSLRLREVINNCVSNAIKYNRTGGTVTLKLLVKDNMTRIVVKDTGVGIPEDKISAVFNEFETVGHVSKHHKGTGLGMPISKRLMEQMGGNLTLKSVVNEGTEFYIDIPTEKVLDPNWYRSRPDMDADLVA